MIISITDIFYKRHKHGLNRIMSWQQLTTKIKDKVRKEVTDGDRQKDESSKKDV